MREFGFLNYPDRVGMYAADLPPEPVAVSPAGAVAVDAVAVSKPASPATPAQ